MNLGKNEGRPAATPHSGGGSLFQPSGRSGVSQCEGFRLMESLKLKVAANPRFRSAGSGNAYPPTRPRTRRTAFSRSSGPVTGSRRPRPPGPGYRVSFPAWGAGSAYLLGMGEEHPGELTGQISINELLIAMGEEPVVSMMDLVVPDDASSITDEPPTLPGL